MPNPIIEIALAEAHQVNLLVSDAFQYEAPQTFFHDFPVWNSDQSVRLGIFEAGQLVSHVGYRIAEMRNAKGTEKVAFIGAVATRASHRARGLSSQLLTEAIKRIDGAHCTWTYLWGSEHAFYAKFGFELAGVQARAPLAKLSFPLKDLAATAIDHGFNDRIFSALITAREGIVLSERDRGWLAAHRSVRWFSIEKPFAFAAFERGLDLKHMVHELGGDLRSLEKILFHVYAQDPAAELIAQESALVSVGFEQKDLLREFLCLARPSKKNAVWKDEFWISGISAC